MTSVLDVFRHKVAELPNAIAVIDENHTSLSYTELDILSSSVASSLYVNGLRPNDIVPLFFVPDYWLIVTILAVLKLGAAYLPISTTFPEERVKYLFREGTTEFIVANQKFPYNGIKVFDVRDIQQQQTTESGQRFGLNADQLAYVLYTSGSTGIPKGVKVTHRNLLHLINNLQKLFSTVGGSRYLLSTPYIFDVSTVELFAWLSDGGTLVTAATRVADIRQLPHLVQKYAISHLCLSPSVLQLIMNITPEAEFQVLNSIVKYLLIGGEEFLPALAQKALLSLPDVSIYNVYGPTELTVYTTAYKLALDEITDNVSIGRELDNVTVHIVRDNRALPCGEMREMWVSGEGVTLGYHNDEKLTREKFVDFEGVRCYRTGDYGIRLNTGNIRYCGRIDDQVQIHGIRIELGEIENTILTTVPEIEQVKVLYVTSISRYYVRMFPKRLYRKRTLKMFSTKSCRGTWCPIGIFVNQVFH